MIPSVFRAAPGDAGRSAAPHRDCIIAPSMNKSTFSIPTDEYEQRRHLFEMHRWINSVLARMDGDPDFNVIYFERKGLSVKKLIEEAIPMTYLGLHLVRIAEDVFIQFYTDNRPYDGQLEVTGFNNFGFKVEVTTTENDDSTLRRQALSRNGTVWFYGPVKRDENDSRKIISEPKMVNLSKREDRTMELAFERFLEKADSGRYDKDTAILVAITMDHVLSFRRRGELLRRSREWLRAHPTAIYGVYYCYQRDGIIDSARPSDRETF